MHDSAISCIIYFSKKAGCQAAANTEFRRRLKQTMQVIAKVCASWKLYEHLVKNKYIKHDGSSAAPTRKIKE